MTDSPSPPRNRMALAVLALVGLLIAVYMLAYALGWTGAVLCGIGDCERVQNSPYARIGPLPVALFGVVGYLALVTVSLVGLQPTGVSSRSVPRFLVVGGLLGLAFSAYLTYLEAFVIHAWCQWCVGSAIIMVLAFAAIIPEFRRLGGPS
ncbi:vitamin K epoxide reductase family protein [Gemmatimonadota bacterium]